MPKIEKAMKEKHTENKDYYDIRYKIRKEKSIPLLEGFIEFVAKDILKAITKSALGKVLKYAKML
ncbi:hypothetical protein [Abyssisolibacter fermentans]|uniref:hypothetical protein n=1 Tax=Abyssisolibacter fermentans TaxID=1766203 RepID=UPI0012E3B366|nr:hypothetical protein [Abyssisolibacter fermentans]